MIGERIVLIRGKQARESFAAELGVHPQTLARYEKGERLPDSAFLEILSKRYSVDPTWLLTGEGPSYMKPTAEASKALEGLEFIDCADCQLTMVPMVDARLSAGTGSFEVGTGVERRYAFRSDWINAKGQPSKMVLMRVAGDSMEPQIFNDDVVLVDQSQTTPRAGGLFAVAVEDLVYLKVVDAVPGKFILKSYNEAYAPLEIDARGDLADGIRIIGRAVWIGRELY
ncbi:XRE family transcriptional regulator [Humidesulfovibrio idahonensis]